jgi:hypothetical protein
MRARQWGVLAVPALLGAAACFYKFNNPVVAQPSGSIAGRLTLVDAGLDQTLEGATVTLQWSGLHVNVDSSGRFLFLDLPDGTFTLRYEVPPRHPNDLPFIGFRHDLFLPNSGGQVDAVDLGNLEISVAATVEGNVIGASGPVVVAAFQPSDPDAGPGEFEGFSTTLDPSVTTHYSLVLPAGTHEISASSATASATRTVAVQPQDHMTGQDLTIGAPANPTSTLTGFLVLGGHGASAPKDSVAPTLSSIVAKTTPEGQPDQTVSGFVQPVQTQGIGAAFTQPLSPPGLEFQFNCTITAAQPPDKFIPSLTIHTLPAIAGRTTHLGQIPWLSASTFVANGIAVPDGG